MREFARLLAEFRPVVVIHKQADPIKKSIAGDRLTCLECGHNKLKTLVRHLREQHNLSPRTVSGEMGLVPSRRWLELGWRSLRVAQPK